MSTVSIKIDSVTLSGSPVGNQHLSVQYKLASDPDQQSSYHMAAADVECYSNGNLVTMLEVAGLQPSTTYTFWIVNICGGAGYKKNFTSPAS